MKIKSVRIRNFRSIKEQTIEFDDYTCLVGANGSGKSNVLHALNVFFLANQTYRGSIHVCSEKKIFTARTHRSPST
jgi:predicted ATP-dependent endonuclease of OLD family